MSKYLPSQSQIACLRYMYKFYSLLQPYAGKYTLRVIDLLLTTASTIGLVKASQVGYRLCKYLWR